MLEKSIVSVQQINYVFMFILSLLLYYVILVIISNTASINCQLKTKQSSNTAVENCPPFSSIWDFPDLVEATTAAVAWVTPRDACCRRCRLVLSLSAFTWREKAATRQETWDLQHGIYWDCSYCVSSAKNKQFRPSSQDYFAIFLYKTQLSNRRC